MKRFIRVLGGVGLAALAFGCSSGSEEPAPFTSAADLASELAARYGAPFAVEHVGGQAFCASPLGDTRSLASSSSEAEAVATDFVQRFGRDFGAGVGVRANREHGAARGRHHAVPPRQPAEHPRVRLYEQNGYRTRTGIAFWSLARRA